MEESASGDDYQLGLKEKNVNQLGGEPQTQQDYPLQTSYPPPESYYGSPQTNQAPFQGAAGPTMTCPTCGKPGYYTPYTPKKSLMDKKFLKVPVVFWVVLLFFIVIFSCVIVTLLSFPPVDNQREIFDQEVIVAAGGHFRYSLGFSFEDKITLNISSGNGSNFDIYIMDEDQYENAYGPGSSQIVSFSSYYSRENINSVSEDLDFSSMNSRYVEYFLIIDNRDTRITPDDASPSGTITLDVQIIIEHPSYYLG